jgi:DNA-directed RNA polymerase specialized sigma24 family protein
MSPPESTCWTVIRGAAADNGADRAELACRYLDVVRAYLAARWKWATLLADLDDAGQEVFVECFQQGGVLDAATMGRVTSFWAFLYGVSRNVARRFENRPALAALPSDIEAIEDGPSRLFERTWARSLMVEAARLQRERARERGVEAIRRVELLRLRFEGNLSIRAIAESWGVPAAGLHHDYALARREFKAILLEVVAFRQPGRGGTGGFRAPESAFLILF